MPRLSSAQQRALDRIRDAAASGVMPSRLAALVMRALSAAIPCDGYRFLGVDPRTLLITRVLAASDNDLDPRNEWLREVYLQSGRLSYIELPEMMRAGMYAAAMQEAIREAANLAVIEGEADDLLLSGGRIAGIRLADGREEITRYDEKRRPDRACATEA